MTHDVALLAKRLADAERQRDENMDALVDETKTSRRLAERVGTLREALQTIAGDGEQYAPCLPGCVEGPPTCDCAETRAARILSADIQ